MASLDSLDLPELNIIDPEFDADICTHWQTARQQHWLARTPVGIMVLGYQEMKEMLLMDDKLEPANKMMTTMLGADGTSFGDFNNKFLLAQQGADHRRLRDLVAASLETGLLSGKIGPDYVFEDGDIRVQYAQYFPWYTLENRTRLSEVFSSWSDLTDKHQCTISQLAIAWTAANQVQRISSAVPGMWNRG